VDSVTITEVNHTDKFREDVVREQIVQAVSAGEGNENSDSTFTIA
jgi:hypothetical protein